MKHDKKSVLNYEFKKIIYKAKLENVMNGTIIHNTLYDIGTRIRREGNTQFYGKHGAFLEA